ncbi:MAG TPA: Clp protease N-terminal domain-containing protein [Acidimicrobiales bacterium]|jgi:hypothetical protein|nr:Clp protease N-terminal domain-containing protein [Acidimicrobiales bacterium]
MDLDQLIRLVRDRADDPSPLGLVHAAVAVSDDVTAVADAVVSHYVEQARNAGHSWAEIGGALGVSKQAVHQKFVKQAASFSFGSRFTGRARTALDNAQAEARGLDHNFVGTEHLLLGILRDRDAVATKALERLGVSPPPVQQAIESMIGRGPQRVHGDQPLTPRAVRALERSLSEALKMGHNYIGTEHLLLGLVGEKDGVAARVLKDLGVKKGALVQTIAQLVATG